MRVPIQAGLGAVFALCAWQGHAAYVRGRRRDASRSGRLLQFSPASQDEVVASGLRTGDVLLFRRDPTLYSALTCACIVARQAVCPYDHAAVVLRVKGEPHVLELAPSGEVKLRRYDARVLTSLSKEIVLRRLALPANAHTHTALLAWAQERAGQPWDDTQATEWLARLTGDAQYNTSVRFVDAALSQLGVHTHTSVRAKEMEPGTQPWAPKHPVVEDLWVRDLR